MADSNLTRPELETIFPTRSDVSDDDDYGEGVFRSECRRVCSTAVARLPHSLNGVSHPK